MNPLAERIAGLLRTHETIKGDNVCMANCDTLAAEIADLFEEFSCAFPIPERWWSSVMQVQTADGEWVWTDQD